MKIIPNVIMLSYELNIIRTLINTQVSYNPIKADPDKCDLFNFNLFLIFS